MFEVLKKNQEGRRGFALMVAKSGRQIVRPASFNVAFYDSRLGWEGRMSDRACYTRTAVRRLIIVVAILAIPFASARALAIDPQCTKMDNKIGCTCALQSGGFIDGNHRWHSPHVRGSGASANPVFEQCIKDAGGGT
jgi:hypothetical protein